MNYIKKVILENFQSHKHTTIKFNNQLNVIVGPSDSGKTAILRGIKWALYNEPSGDYFIREGENYCSVTIEFNDTTKIKRYRSRSKNSYHLYDSNNKEQIFEGFGTGVPQEIIEKTGIKKILLDSDISNAINLSDQLEGPFLLSQRGSVRASSIGRLVGVNVIDESLRETLKDSRNLSNNKRNIENDILILEKELTEYDYLKKLEKKINSLELIKNKISEKEKLKKKYQVIFNNFINLWQEKKIIKKHIQKLKNINKLDDISKEISFNLIRYKELDSLRNDYKIVTESKNINNNTIFTLKNTPLLEKNLINLTLKLDLARKVNNINNALNKNTNEIKSLKDNLNNLKNLNKIYKLINKAELKITNLNNIKQLNKKNTSLKQSLKIGKNYLDKLYYTDKINELYISLDNKIFMISKLNLILKKYNKNTEEINSNIKFLEENNKLFNDNLYKYKSFLKNQEFCPFCFSSIDDDKIEHIINHYN